jgi:hypothetical protein
VGSSGVEPYEVYRSSVKTHEVDGIGQTRTKCTVVV